MKITFFPRGRKFGKEERSTGGRQSAKFFWSGAHAREMLETLNSSQYSLDEIANCRRVLHSNIVAIASKS